MKKRKLFSRWFILPAVVTAMGLVLITGFTMAFFSDAETSNANASTAWTSAMWTQTSQSDFGAGVLSNVNASVSSGDVVLSAGSGSGANMILFWDGGSAPSGWTIVSGVGGDFYQRFPRGEATYGTTGGSETHTHTATFGSTSEGNGTVAIASLSGAGALPAHTHNLASSTISTDSNLPSYRDLKVIKYSDGIPTTIPMGAIAIFDTTPPSSWTQYSSQNGYFVRGEATAAVTGGNATHAHTMDITTQATTNTGTPRTGGSISYATSTHTHTQAASTNPAVSNNPPYITVILAKANGDTAIPGGMIAMFDASPTGDWSVVSNSGGAFYRNFLLGGGSYGATGGSDSHNHSNQVVTLSAVTGTASNGKNTQSSFASAAHTHTVSVTSFSTANNLPPYINVIYAKALYNSSGTVASQVLDTAVTGSRWDGLAWTEWLASGTDITFEVRASDTSFLKDDGTPSWTAVGGTSPVISSLSPGRYKQWRATLTADGSKTSTPLLQEVRIFYYAN